MLLRAQIQIHDNCQAVPKLSKLRSRHGNLLAQIAEASTLTTSPGAVSCIIVLCLLLRPPTMHPGPFWRTAAEYDKEQLATATLRTTLQRNITVRARGASTNSYIRPPSIRTPRAKSVGCSQAVKAYAAEIRARQSLPLVTTVACSAPKMGFDVLRRCGT